MAKKGTNRTVKTRIRCTSCDVVYYNPLAAALELHEEPFTTMRTFKTKEGLIKNVKSAPICLPGYVLRLSRLCR